MSTRLNSRISPSASKFLYETGTLIGCLALGAFWFFFCRQNRISAIGGVAFFGCVGVLTCPLFLRVWAVPERRRLIENAATVMLGLAFFCAVIISENSGGGWGNGALFIDEAYTISTIRHSFSSIIDFCAQDTHPPLFYFYAKCWREFFGENISVMRLCLLVPCAVLLTVVVCFLRSEYSRMAGIVFLLFWNAAALTLYYSVELRDYTLALCFMSLVCVSAAHIIRDSGNTLSKKPYLVLFASVSGAAYTHYFAALFVAIGCGTLFLYLCIFDRRKVPLLLLTGALSVLTFLPWIRTAISVTSVVSENYNVYPSATFSDTVNLACSMLTSDINLVLHPPGISLSVAFVFAVSIAVFILHKNALGRRFSAGLLMVFFFFYLFLVGYSFTFKNVMAPRYLLVGIIPFYLFVAIQLASIRRWLLMAVILSTLFASMVCNFIWGLQHRKFSNGIFNYYNKAIANSKNPNDIFYIGGKLDPNSKHLRLIYSAFCPKSPQLYRGDRNEILSVSDGLGSADHISRVYSAEFVNADTIRDWSRFDAVNAYVFLWPDDQPKRFEQVLGNHATHLRGTEDMPRLYQVIPASKLANYFSTFKPPVSPQKETHENPGSPKPD